MGNDHQVIDNQISNQTGPGVVVAAYPESRRNRIQGNQFQAIAGLSIDLVTQANVRSLDYQQGDGPNPPRNSPNRPVLVHRSGMNKTEDARMCCPRRHYTHAHLTRSAHAAAPAAFMIMSSIRGFTRR